MKVFLNEDEVKAALTQYVKTNFLNYESFDIEVMDITDLDGDSFGTDGCAKAIVGVSKRVAEAVTPVAPCAPAPMPVAVAPAKF